ncbi:hypothetical protein GCM10010503_03330 [Streptomyces lucensis JCM 4490]|uniref:ATP-binding protein n=1 Tax=Streptomyces lucensis JCM 4490 TaxID=1306176 RepID=A0A918MKK7_9ACTN|nr:ATP-binding protein [Streptomyces lucensis]GGW31038.1 hypothetical protein GCM10010503_03330 [Streptomyces lucensis JCM 4490]
MKQSAAKTLGVAALGAAFAAAGAGMASAAPAVPDAAQTLGTVTDALPAQQVAGTLSGDGTPQQVGSMAEPGVATAMPAARDLAAAQPAVGSVLAQGPTAPVAGLLGGLPVHGLPTQGVAVNGVPVG